ITRPATRTTTLLLVGGLLLAGCGRSGGGSPVADDPTPPVTSAPAPTTTPTPTPVHTPRPTRKPRPTGNGDSQGDGKPATEGGGVCAALGSADVGGALGDQVAGSALPGGGCEFDPSSSGAPSASVVETSYAGTPGGMDGAKTTATSSVEGDPVDLTGIGEAAFVVTGTAFGEPAIQGAGAVKVGDRLVNVTVSQGQGLSKAKVKALVVALLKVVAAKLG
ncbi:MAG: hypothetical protein ACJ72E_13280, partial [Marmoricola sp.]